MFEKIAESPIFKGINIEEITRILNVNNHQIRTFHAGQTVASNGEECKNLLILMEGSVKGEMVDFSGKTIKIEDIEAPRPLAAGFLFGKNNKYPVDIVANNDVKVLFIPKSAFVGLLQSNMMILNNFLNVISNRTQFLSDKIRFLSFKTIKEKTAYYLLELAKNNSTSIILPKSQQELADFFGVARPSFARVLGELESESIIKVNRREIIITDKNKLIELLK